MTDPLRRKASLSKIRRWGGEGRGREGRPKKSNKLIKINEGGALPPV